MSNKNIKWLEHNFDGVEHRSVNDLLETIFSDFIPCIYVNSVQNDRSTISAFTEMFKMLNRYTLSKCTELSWSEIVKNQPTDESHIDTKPADTNEFDKLYPKLNDKLSECQLNAAEVLMIKSYFMTYYHNCKIPLH